MGATPEAARAALKEASGARGFDGWVRTIEESARAILADAGVDLGELTTADDGQPVDYAARILKLIGAARAEIAAGRPDVAARYAAELGYLTREAELKGWEQDALRGRKNADSLRQGAAARNAFARLKARSAADAWLPRAREKMAEPGWNPSRTAAWVKVQPWAPNLKEGTIRKKLAPRA